MTPITLAVPMQGGAEPAPSPMESISLLMQPHCIGFWGHVVLSTCASGKTLELFVCELVTSTATFPVHLVSGCSSFACMYLTY